MVDQLATSPVGERLSPLIRCRPDLLSLPDKPCVKSHSTQRCPAVYLRRPLAVITNSRRLLWQRRKKDSLLSRPNNRHPVEHPFSVRHRSGKCPEQPARKYQTENGCSTG